MRREARRAHGERQRIAETPRHGKHLALVRKIEPVAGFHFERGHALAHQPEGTCSGAVEQDILAGFARRAHGARDAAAARRDIGITHALKPLFELPAAIAAEHEMRMTVDQPGRHPCAFEIHALDIAGIGRRAAWTDPFEARAIRQNCRVVDDRVFAARHRRGVAVLPELFHRAAQRLPLAPSIIGRSRPCSRAQSARSRWRCRSPHRRDA